MNKLTREQAIAIIMDDFAHYEPEQFIAQWNDLYGTDETAEDFDFSD